jgi:hypothetical protein
LPFGKEKSFDGNVTERMLSFSRGGAGDLP